MSRLGRRAFLFFFATLGSYFFYLVYWNKGNGRDWLYFSGLSFFVRSAIFQYHRLPLQIPWACGGLDFMANPQNRLFSPSVLLDLALPPQLANLASLVIYGWLGMVGMFLLLRELRLSPTIATIGAVLFVNCGWFGLHFMEGHIAFGAMLLFPWVAWAWLRLPRRSSIALLGGLFALFILDGALYALIFSLLMMLGLYVTTPGKKELHRGLLEQWRYVVLCAVTSLCLSAVKLLPVLIALSGREPRQESEVLSVPHVIRALFYPLQQIQAPSDLETVYPWHEYGCYLGILAVVLVLSSLSTVWKSSDRRFLWLTLFWFWVATGWGTRFNPWVVFQRLPLVSIAHVQSRVFILMVLFFVILLARALEGLQNRPRLLGVVAALLLAESFFVRNYPVAGLAFSQHAIIGQSELIESQTIASTLYKWEAWEKYRQRDVGSKTCYEPSIEPSAVSASDDPEYRGEVYVTEGMGEAKLLKYLPGEIELSYRLDRPGVIGLNTNALYGWRVTGGELVSRPDKLLAVATAQKEGIIRLDYRPFYLLPAFILSGAGVVLALPVIGGLRPRKKTTSTYNYEGIPAGFYQEVIDSGNPIRRTWHLQKFERIIDFLPEANGLSILDVGCFAGTFLSLLPKEKFSSQLGVDIIEKQIAYARERFGTPFREFRYTPTIAAIGQIDRKFDCITLIEVIEHLTREEAAQLLGLLADRLKKGGRLVISTPNYVSSWPLIEWLLNHLSDVSYEEQHLTKFNYFTADRKMLSLQPGLDEKLAREIKTTTHFISPFLAAISEKFARELSRRVPHKTWRFPFGNLVLLTFVRK